MALSFTAVSKFCTSVETDWKIGNLVIISIFKASGNYKLCIFGDFLNEACRIKSFGLNISVITLDSVSFSHGSIHQT